MAAMVVVSIQYRLGIFGFLAFSALSDVHREEGKGNYGIEDSRFSGRCQPIRAENARHY